MSRLDRTVSECVLTDRNLRLVAGEGIYELGRKPETLSDQARRLHREAQVLAAEEVDLLRQILADAVTRAEAIRDGGDIFPVGVREHARQLAGSLPHSLLTLQALTERHLRTVIGEPIAPR